MSAYDRAQVDAAVLRREARGWRAARLIDDGELRRIDAHLPTDLRTSNLPLRILFFILTLIAIGPVWYLLSLPFGDHLARVIVGVLAYVAAGHLVAARMLYRSGGEEALFLVAPWVVGWGISGLLYGSVPPHLQASGISLVQAAGCAWCARRFHSLLAMLLAVFFFCQTFSGIIASPTLWRFVCCGWTALLFAAAFASMRASGSEAMRRDLRNLQAVLLVAMYGLAYLKPGAIATFLGESPAQPYELSPLHFWISYGLIIAIPVAGAIIGLMSRVRVVFDVGIALALVTLMTNKAYLGKTRLPYDPIILGAALIAGAYALMWWLRHGREEGQWGLTAKPFGGAATLETGAAISAAIAAMPPLEVQQPPGTTFGGGQSGGAGTTRGT